MIRMGRSSRPEPVETSNLQQQNTSSSYNYGNETASVTQRAVTDSEAMARDIKEGRLSGFVGHGTVLSGETNFQAMLRVDGHLVGSVASDSGTLIVGANGQVDANISVSSAVINGVVNGDIIATEKVQLGRGARVIGNIQTPRIIIEDGAIFEGGCTMLKAREISENKHEENESRYGRTSGTYGTSSDSDENETDANSFFVTAEDESEEEEDEVLTA